MPRPSTVRGSRRARRCATESTTTRPASRASSPSSSSTSSSRASASPTPTRMARPEKRRPGRSGERRAKARSRSASRTEQSSCRAARRNRRQQLPRGFVVGTLRPRALRRPQVGRVNEPREAVLSHREPRHEVQPEQDQIGEIVAGERFVRQMGVDEAQSPEPPAGDPLPLEVRKLDPVSVPDADPGHRPAAVHQYADLTANGPRYPGELPGELLGEERRRGQPPPGEALQGAPVTGPRARRCLLRPARKSDGGFSGAAPVLRGSRTRVRLPKDPRAGIGRSGRRAAGPAWRARRCSSGRS